MSTSREGPKVPIESVVYGEVVYWITILAAILCMVGPLVAVARPGNNLLDPHKVFAAIFAEEEPGGVWALSATEEPHLMIRRSVAGGQEFEESVGVHAAVGMLAELEAPTAGAPSPSLLVGGGLKLVRRPEGAEEDAAFMLHRVLDGREDEGMLVSARKARVELLDEYKNVVVSDGHFWTCRSGRGDCLTQFGLALGCSVALWGLLLAAGIYLRKGVVLFALLAIWVAGLVFVSAAGLVNLH